MAGPDFFISYTTADEAWAKWIAVTLEQDGYTTIVQAFDFRPGGDFMYKMQKATSGDARTIAVLTEAYLTSEFGALEWQSAIAEDPTGEKGLLLPVRVEMCKPPGLLRTRIYVDLVGIEEAIARKKLLAAADRDRPRPTHAPFPGSPGAQPTAAPAPVPYPGPATTDASHAQGVIIGTGGTQYNFFGTGAAPLDHGLGKLSPQVSAGRLLNAAHANAVAVLADASDAAAADVLRIILRREPDRAVGMIANLHPDRVKALVRRLAEDAPWLVPLDLALDAIDECQERMGWTLDQAISQVTRAERSERGTTGFFRAYEGGHIHWSERYGAFATVGEMSRSHTTHGGSGGRLGFPVTDEDRALPSPQGTTGTLQRFEGAAPYPAPVSRSVGVDCGATLYRSARGLFPTWGIIGACFEAEGGTDGWLGFPTSTVAAAGPSMGGSTGWIQRFEGGRIASTKAYGAIAMRPEVAAYHAGWGGCAGPLGFPSARAKAIRPSPGGFAGWVQTFEGHAGTGILVYTSDLNTFAVGPEIAIAHEELGGPLGWLGLPTADEEDCASGSPMQRFEGGAIFRPAAGRPIAVSEAVIEELEAGGATLLQMIGDPISAEFPADRPGTAVQMFANGVVTIQDGTPTVWVRPPRLG